MVVNHQGVLMTFEFQRFALTAALSVALCAAALGGQHSKAKSNPPAEPPAKTTQPATHFTQGTITSIGANQMVITKKVRGKAEQASFTLNSETQRDGSLAAGTRVSIQYREAKGQKIAAAVRELTAKITAMPDKIAFKSRSKS
jgi:hypothetical protein